MSAEPKLAYQELALNDSYIQRIELNGSEVSLVFSRAHIHSFSKEGEWLPGLSEYKTARLTLTSAVGRVPSEGLVLDGYFRLGGERLLNIPLKGVMTGDLELHLIMDSGEFSFKFQQMRLTALAPT